MGVEIEKKYRLSQTEAEALRERLELCGAEFRGEEFETNTLYAGGNLDQKRSILRVREQSETAILTYKESIEADTSIKMRREDETEVDDAEALRRILDALGFTASLVYEKRRQTFDFAGCEVVIDELPFGWFAEIEGASDDIREAEKLLQLLDAVAEQNSYPALTTQHGIKREGVIEARFSQ